jgi:hypothetical protein
MLLNMRRNRAVARALTLSLRVWLLAALSALMLPSAALAGDSKHAAEIAAAQKAGDAWLQLLDAEKYDQCWQQSSAFFQKKVPEIAFQKGMDTVRKPLDPVVTRTLHTSEYKTELSGLPKGEYVAFVWETVFSNSKEMLESLIMTDEAGQWKMIGYAVQ